MDWADRIGRRIKLRDLHILLAVAECGSMAKASARLSVSHPVVSKTILELERTLGIRLFDRSSQGVEVTAHGAALLNCGVTVFNEMRHGLKLLEALSDPTSGELRIGCTEITMAGLLPAIVEKFSQQFPRIRLHVVLVQAPLDQFQELRERNVDLVIGSVPRQQLAAAATEHHHLFRATDRHFDREWTVCRRVAKLGCAVPRQTGGTENIAVKAAACAFPGKYRDTQEPDAEPGGEPVRQMRTSGDQHFRLDRKATRQIRLKDAMDTSPQPRLSSSTDRRRSGRRTPRPP